MKAMKVKHIREESVLDKETELLFIGIYYSLKAAVVNTGRTDLYLDTRNICEEFEQLLIKHGLLEDTPDQRIERHFEQLV